MGWITDRHNRTGIGLAHGPISDYTLCGLTLDGDEATVGGFASTTEKIDCLQRIEYIRYCKLISTKHY